MATPLLPADPRANYLAHREEIRQAIDRVLESGWYILGEEVSAFEQEFARYIGGEEAVAVGSGTDALHLGLRCCGIVPGDAVFTVSHTAVATVAAIELAGAIPILVDIDPKTFTMDPDHLEGSIKHYLGKGGEDGPRGRLRAILPVHLYGHPADMEAILAIARRYGLMVIEDCAQSHGAALQGRKTGTWGDLAAFSFYPTKNLGALGDGGALVSNHPELGERARLLRQYGWQERYISVVPGINSRLDAIQAAILRVKLTHLDRENARRQELAAIYDQLLSDTSLRLPVKEPGIVHAFHQYVIRTPRRDGLRNFLQAHAISTLIHYPVPVHLQPAYRGRIPLGLRGLPHTERACQEILSLPMHPQMTGEQAQQIGELISDWDSHRGQGK